MKLFAVLALVLCSFAQDCPELVAGGGSHDLGKVAINHPSVHVLVLGDFGYGNELVLGLGKQFAVAQAISAYAAQHSFDLAITVGDNFYMTGVSGTNDRVWNSRFEQPYAKLKIPFFPTLGNHDYHGRSVESEIRYTGVSPSHLWRMPSNYYKFSAGRVEFFALDTALSAVESDAEPRGCDGAMLEKELKWLQTDLPGTEPKWRIAYCHRPVYSVGYHSDTKFLKAKLLPVLDKQVQILFAGHDHNLQDLSDKSGVRFFISGGGGAPHQLGDRRKPSQAKSECFYDGYGFADLIADDQSLTVNLIGVTGRKATIIHTAVYRDGAWTTNGSCKSFGRK